MCSARGSLPIAWFGRCESIELLGQLLLILARFTPTNCGCAVSWAARAFLTPSDWARKMSRAWRWPERPRPPIMRRRRWHTMSFPERRKRAVGLKTTSEPVEAACMSWASRTLLVRAERQEMRTHMGSSQRQRPERSETTRRREVSQSRGSRPPASAKVPTANRTKERRQTRCA